jgi:hypothetical protein
MRSLGGKIRVRVKRRWRGYAAGAVIQPPAALRQILLQEDVVEIVPEPAAALEQAGPAAEGAEQMKFDTPPVAETSAASTTDEDEKTESAPEKKKRKRKHDAGDE